VYHNILKSLKKLLSKNDLSKSDKNMIEAYKHIIFEMENVYDLITIRKRSQAV